MAAPWAGKGQGMSTAQKRSIDISDLAAALGSNVVRFAPPSRDEAQAANSEWAASLELIDEAAALFKATEDRAAQAEERAERVAFKAMEGLRSAQARVDKAEAHARAVEEHTAEEIRLARGRIAETEAWAQEAEARAREAESRGVASALHGGAQTEAFVRRTAASRASPFAPQRLESLFRTGRA
jgi:hypothetical protein